MMAEPRGKWLRLFPNPRGLPRVSEERQMHAEETESCGQVPEGTGGPKDLDGTTPRTGPVARPHEEEVVDRLHGQDVTNQLRISHFSGELMCLVDHLLGRLAIPAGGEQDRHFREQAGAIRVDSTFERGKPAPGHLQGLLPPGGPAQLVRCLPAGSARRIDLTSALVQSDRISPSRHDLVPPSQAAEGRPEPNSMSARARSWAEWRARATSKYRSASSWAAASKDRSPARARYLAARVASTVDPASRR